MSYRQFHTSALGNMGFFAQAAAHGRDPRPAAVESTTSAGDAWHHPDSRQTNWLMNMAIFQQQCLRDAHESGRLAEVQRYRLCLERPTIH